jgi:endonuclease VIII
MEGPSLVILTGELEQFAGKEILSVSGKSKFGIEKLSGQKLIRTSSWGKHFLITFSKTILKIHFLMFGSYRINERKDRASMLSLEFANGEINFYTCAISEISVEEIKKYDWRVDIMSDQWSEKHVLKKVKENPDQMVCDILLDQELFSGSGNIIKNEVLYRLKLHPEVKIDQLKRGEALKLVREARAYAFDFFRWKKEYKLIKNWKIYRKRKCKIHNTPVTTEKTGKLKRVSFYCKDCQPARFNI